jgi:hypothetical protein
MVVLVRLGMLPTSSSRSNVCIVIQRGGKGKMRSESHWGTGDTTSVVILWRIVTVWRVLVISIFNSILSIHTPTSSTAVLSVVVGGGAITVSDWVSRCNRSRVLMMRWMATTAKSVRIGGVVVRRGSRNMMRVIVMRLTDIPTMAPTTTIVITNRVAVVIIVLMWDSGRGTRGEC